MTWTNEDFTTYSETDPNTHIETTSATHIDFIGYRNEDAYLNSDKGVDYFTDFTHSVNVKVLSANSQDSAVTPFWVLANMEDDVLGIKNAGSTSVFIWTNKIGSDYIFKLYETYTNSWSSSAVYTLSADNWYYIDFKKVGTDLKAVIHSDSAKATPLDTLSITLRADHNFRYVYGCNTYNTGASLRLDLDIETLSFYSANGAGGTGTDSMGNYPDGLLYETGLSLSGNVTDIYAGEDDVVIPIVHRHETIHDAAKKYNEIYGLKSFIDPTDDYYHLLSATVDFPTLSYTLSYGADINSSNLSWDGRDKDHGVIVYGSPPFFYKTGSSPYTYLYDANITSLEIAKEKAKNWYNIHTRSKGIAQGSITVPAITHSLIGYKIVIEDDDRGWSGYGNVVGMNHTLRADRWTTEVLFENVPPDNAKTLAEVLEEIESMEDEPTYMGVYDCFYPFDTSSTGLVSNSTTYASISAIGFGTSSANSTSATPQGLVDIRRFTDRVDDWYYFMVGANWGNEKYNNTGSSALIKEMFIFKNDNSDGHPYLATVSATLSRPANTFDDTDFDVDLATYTFNIDTIEADGFSYRLNDGHAAKIGWAPTASSSPNGETQDGVLSADLNKTGSYWANSNQHEKISASDLDSVSWDCYSKSADFYRFERNPTSGEVEDVIYQFTIKTGLVKEQAADIDEIRLGIVARTSHTKSGETSSINMFNFYIWNFAEESYLLPSQISQSVGLWGHKTKVMDTPESAHQRIDKHGTIHGCLRVKDIESNSSMSLDIAYIYAFVKRGVPNTIIEKGRFRSNDSIKDYMFVKRPIKYLEGLYTESDGSGENVAKMPIITGYKTVVNPLDSWYCVYPRKETKPIYEDPASWFGKYGGISDERLDSWMLYREKSWAHFNMRRGLSPTQSLYIKYMAETHELGTQMYEDNYGFSRSSDGSAKDKLIWQIKTSSDDRMSQNFPAYGLPYKVKFYHLGKDDSVGNPAATEGDVKYRMCPRIGIDKIREKTLTCAFEK